MATDKLEFASPEWMNAIASVLEQTLAGVDLDGAEIVISEEFTDPPAHLVGPGRSTIAWHFRVSDQGVSVGTGLAPDSTISTVATYDATLPLARCVYGSSPEAISNVTELRNRAYRTGSRQGDETALPPALLERLVQVHNAMASRTL